MVGCAGDIERSDNDMENTWYVIVNPAADSDKGLKHWQEIEALLYKMEVPFVSQLTDKKGHAIEITREAIKEGYRKIFAVGGDGTINEVVNGILTQDICPSTDVLVTLASMGTGNDWIKTMGIPDKFLEATRLLKEGTKIQTIDAGLVKYHEGTAQKQRYFVNVAGMAYDAYVTKDANENALFKGKLQYIISVLKGLTSYKSTHVTATIDGKVYEDTMFCLNVGICRFAGGGMMIVPQAVPDDGQFHVTLIKDLSKLQVVFNIVHLFKGTFIQHPKVEHFPAKAIHVESDKPIYVEVEGEVLGHTPFDYEILPGAIKVLVG